MNLYTIVVLFPELSLRSMSLPWEISKRRISLKHKDFLTITTDFIIGIFELNFLLRVLEERFKTLSQSEAYGVSSFTSNNFNLRQVNCFNGRTDEVICRGLNVNCGTPCVAPGDSLHLVELLLAEVPGPQPPEVAMLVTDPGCTFIHIKPL